MVLMKSWNFLFLGGSGKELRLGSWASVSGLKVASYKVVVAGRLRVSDLNSCGLRLSTSVATAALAKQRRKAGSRDQGHRDSHVVTEPNLSALWK